LRNAVCSECNQYFGNKLEVRFTRGTFEALLRYDKGLKPAPQGVIKLPYVEPALPPGTEWSGVRLGPRMEEKLRVHLLPQVAFRERSTPGWVHITAQEGERDALADTSHLDTSSARLFAGSLEERDSLLAKLRGHGITFTRVENFAAPQGLFDGRDLEVELTVTVNKGIRRCAAKYVFNYLALECGPEFALETDFDPIRRFVRHGATADEELVAESVPQQLRNYGADGKVGAGHVVAITSAPNDFDLRGHVSLFNCISFAVLLARRFSGPAWPPIRRGVRYDIASMTVQPLG